MISQEENKENIIQNSLNKNYPLKNIKTKNKKITSNKFEEKPEKKKKENIHRKKLDKYNRGKSEKIKMVEILNEEDIDKIETLNINKIEKEYCHTRSSTLDDFDFLRIDNLERPIVIRRVIYRVFKYKIKKKK